VVESGRL